jgi:hypothetical protein
MKMLIVAAVAIAALTPAGLASARTDSPARAAATTVSVRGKEFCTASHGSGRDRAVRDVELERRSTGIEIPAAIANDVYRVTGRRIRSLPIAVGQLLLSSRLARKAVP